jgi:hypothetical protein
LLAANKKIAVMELFLKLLQAAALALSNQKFFNPTKTICPFICHEGHEEKQITSRSSW